MNELHKKWMFELVAVYLVLTMGLIGFYYASPAITGFIIASNQFSYADSLDLDFNQSQNYTWILENPGLLKAVKISGTVENKGSAKVYIENNNERLLIFDSSELNEKGVLDKITGFVAADTKEKKNKAPVWNSSADSFVVNETLTIDLNDYFIDKDDNILTYSASSISNIGILLVDSILTINNKNNIEDNRTLELTASDNETSKKKNIELILIKKIIINETPAVNITPINTTPINVTPINVTNETINITLPLNETNISFPINDSDNITPIINETIENKTQINKSINLNLEYKTGSFYDVDDNGIETTTGIVDLSVESSKFNWPVDESKLCTRWDTYSVENAESTIACYGSSECCNFVDLQPTRPDWNETFFSYYGLYGATFNNEISAQVLYVDINLSVENPKADIAFSEWKDLKATYYEGLIKFDNICKETCALFDFNETSYKLVIEVNNTELKIDSINYTIEKEVDLFNSPPELIKNITNLTIAKNRNISVDLSKYFSDSDGDILKYAYYDPNNLSVAIEGSIATIVPDIGFTGNRYMFFTANDTYSSTVSNVFKVSVDGSKQLSRIEIGKPVKWVERVNVENATEKEDIKILLPLTASNLSIKTIKSNAIENIPLDKAEIIDKGVNKTILEFEKSKEIEKIGRKISLLKEAKSIEAKVLVDDIEINLTDVNDRLNEFESEKSDLESESDIFFGLITGNVIQEIEEIKNNESVLVINDTSVLIDSDEIEIEYITEAPAVLEQKISSGKRIKIISEVSYENVFAYTNIEESKKENIKLFWIKNNTRELFSNVDLIDTNLNGLIDRLEWVVPHLSNQTFEVSITIINLQSFPTVGGNWTVRFNTTGTGNLTILASNGTTYEELNNDNSFTVKDLIPLKLTCEDYEHFDKNGLLESSQFFVILENNSKVEYFDTLNKELIVKGVYVSSYNCSGTGYWTVKVLTPGAHTQQFNFSGEIAYAKNLASESAGVTNGSKHQFIDDTDTDFLKGVFNGTNISGAGSGANVTLNRLNATGGTITYSGGYTIHTFTANGTFNVTGAGDVEYLVVAGGGGGGGSRGGGGGAGGFRTATGFAVTAQSYTITVGHGGTGSTAKFVDDAVSGADSTFSTISSSGGGEGGTNAGNAQTGGSGGGAGTDSGGPYTGAAGNSGSYTPAEGTAGGDTSGNNAGGGGGATSAGADASAGAGGNGGAGTASSISGSSVTYAGGGGGGVSQTSSAGSGGTGGGGNGASGNAVGSTASANTGGGGGGGGYDTGVGDGKGGGNGGSGIVIIRYPTVTYTTSGNFTSQAFDANKTVNWSFMSWTNTTTVNTNLSMHYRTSADNVTYTDWTRVTNNTLSVLTSNTIGRYFQYLAAFNTSNATFTPILNNVSINYSLRSNLTIWDDTDDFVKVVNQNVRFYANFTDFVNTINGSNINCSYSDNSTAVGSWSAPVNMSFNSTTGLYYHDKSFARENNTYHYNITCDATILGYNVLKAIDDFIIYPSLNITVDLNVTTTTASKPIAVSGHINLSNGTNATNTNITVFINNVNVTNATTNTLGNYNVTITSNSTAGTYTIKVNTTWADTIPGEQTATLRVTSIPVINTNFTVPTYPRFGENVTFTVNVTDADPSITSVNFTLIDPSGTKVIDNKNGSKASGDLYNTTFNLSSYGTWLWNVSVFDSDGFIINTSTLEIILMELTANLNDSTPSAGASVVLSGKVNLSNSSNVSNNLIQIFVDGAEEILPHNFTDDSDADFLKGVFNNTNISGTGSEANLTLNRFNATGGTITYSGGYTIHTFTANGTFNTSGVGNVEVLVVAGGGGGGSGDSSPGGGGGGAGGYIYNASYATTSSSYTVIVGEGGLGSTVLSVRGGKGTNSSFGSIFANGGGGGGSYGSATAGGAGGSGGGSTYGATIGSGTEGQGNNGGLGVGAIDPGESGGGGGGAGAVGAGGSADDGGNGGAGTSSSISGSAVTYAGGGGGGNGITGGPVTGTGNGGTGGAGGGGNGGTQSNGVAATANTGGGGGGAGSNSPDQNSIGGDGGSGIVIIRYPNVTYPTSGNFTSRAFDAGGAVNWTSISWSNTTPVNTNLSMYYRTSADNITYSDWNQVGNNTYSVTSFNSTARYFQYLASFNTSNTNFTPILNNVTINYTGIFTDSFGNYNYTLTAPSTAGTYTIKVNTTWAGTIPGEQTATLPVKVSQTVNLTAGGAFIIQDSTGTNIAIIDSNGNMNIKGSLTQSAEPTADTNDFVIQNSTGGLNLVITNPEGNMLIKDSLQQSQASPISPTLNSFIIENSSAQVLAYLNSTGGFFLAGALTENVLFG